MNLIIDIGNTRAKLAVFDGDNLLFTGQTERLGTKHVEALKDRYPQINRAILSAVRDYPREVRDFLCESFATFINLRHDTPMPLANRYKTPETLGLDRLAVAVGAAYIFPNQNLMVIDAGTAITFDFVNDKGEYLGGNISPGLEMRFKALSHFTGNLPYITPSDIFRPLGDNTETAIRAGVQMGMIFEIESYINYFNSIYRNLKILMTGGDSFIFEKKIKYGIFVNPDLCAEGLNRILEFNN